MKSKLSIIHSMNSHQTQTNYKRASTALWKCKHCGLYNYPVEAQCKACFYYQSQNKMISHTTPMQIIKQKKYEYKSPLNMILKRPLIAKSVVCGYIRTYIPFYPTEIIQMIYSFYFIPILSYEIKSIGFNGFGQQGIGSYENIHTLKTIKTYQKQIKNIIIGCQNIYILFTDSTYECCGCNRYGQLGINIDTVYVHTLVQN
eukprot:471898_1